MNQAALPPSLIVNLLITIEDAFLRPLFVFCRVGYYPPPNPVPFPPKGRSGSVNPELPQRMDCGQTSIEAVIGC